LLEDHLCDTGASKITYKKYKNPTIRRFLLNDRAITTSVDYDAEILKVDTDHDLALLRVVNPNFPVPKITFKKANPPLASRVLICGNMGGDRFPLSISDGTIGAYSREMSGNKFLLNQLNVSIIAGCSGGGAYEEASGELIGIVVMGAYPNETCFTYCVPSSAILAWLGANDLGFVLDENKKDDMVDNGIIIPESVHFVPTTQKLK
jgi:S1-C subfamily serine protease